MEARSSEMGSTNPDKNLEEKIKESGAKLTSPPTSADELLPLLDEAELLLARVDQSPSPSMTSTLKPMMTALAAKGMLSHPDADVRVTVAACISEVTRITAPDAPYEDDLMKELFKRIVESFEKLDDLTSRSFNKRLSILETVAKVRSCVVMLDLECDDLIFEMFQHFLKAISIKHQDNIFTSMETIMSLVIEESEEISKELLSCLLQSVRKDRMERLPVSFKLGEKVIRNCADKLKPLLTELVGNRTNEYSKFVVSLCQQETSDAMDQSDIDASAKNAPEESKMSERTVSDERPQESDKAVEQEPETEGPEEGSAAQNGEVEAPPVVDGNGDSVIEEPPSPKQKAERPSRVIKKSTKAKEAETKATPATVKTNKRKAAPVKQAESSGSQEVLSDKKEEEAVPKNDAPDLSTPVPELGSRPKRGRSGTMKTAASAKKEVVEGASDSEGKSLRLSARKGVSASTDAKKGGPKSQKKEEEVPKGKKKEEEVPKGKKKEEEGPKSQKEGPKSKKKEEEAAPASSEEDDSQDIRVRDIVAAKANAKKHAKEKAKVGESSGSKRNRVSEKEQKEKEKEKEKEKDREEKKEHKESGGKKQKKYDGSIIGERIKVWWPDDDAFYNGTVQKYNHTEKRHTVAYDDGDVEVLHLKDEVWDFLEEDEEETPPDSLKSKKAKTSSVKDIKETPKSSKTAGGKSKAKEPEETPKTATSSKRDAKSKDSVGKTAPKSKSNGVPEKASGGKPASGAKSAGGTRSKRKGGRN